MSTLCMNFLAVLLSWTACAWVAVKTSGTCRGHSAILLYMSDVVLVIASFFQANHHWVQVVPMRVSRSEFSLDGLAPINSISKRGKVVESLLHWRVPRCSTWIIKSLLSGSGL